MSTAMLYLQCSANIEFYPVRMLYNIDNPAASQTTTNTNLELIIERQDYQNISAYNTFKYILVTVDYVTKWVETIDTRTNDASVVTKFLKDIFARFGTPRTIINDGEKHYVNRLYAGLMKRYGVYH